MFVFPGQGAQYPGMGPDLYHHHRVFAATLDECDRACAALLAGLLRDVMFAKTPQRPRWIASTWFSRRCSR